MLVYGDVIVIDSGFVERRFVTRDASDPDAAWRALEAELRGLHTDYAVDKAVIQLGTTADGTTSVPYQDLASATDAARASGIVFVRY